jgi:hypothetical protein
MHEAEKVEWGFFRPPAIFGPMVGFLACLGSMAMESPGSGGSSDGLIALPLVLVIATLFAAIPYLLGAFLLLTACRVLPSRWIRITPIRLVLGGLIGALIEWPFAHALNWMIPSASADPRFDYSSVLVGSVVAGGYCAAFFSEARPGSRSQT